MKLCYSLAIFIIVSMSANVFAQKALLQSTHLYHEAYPGGVVGIIIPSNHQSKPEVYFKNTRVFLSEISEEKYHWLAIVGIGLGEKPGQKNIVWKKGKEDVLLAFEIVDKEYEKQYITIKNKSKVNPNSNQLERISKEIKQMSAAYRRFINKAMKVPKFDLPVKGRLSSPFGLKRYFNQQARKPHGGIDIAAPKGTDIRAPMEGVVTLRGKFFFNGHTIMIDHGQGLVSMYCHLDDIFVERGARLMRGANIGTVGQSGRATGPHLHWSISLNGNFIDPILLLDQKFP